MYNSDVRAYKMAYETIVRKIFEEIGVTDDCNVLDFDVMVELLLNTIYTLRAGDWLLLIE